MTTKTMSPAEAYHEAKALYDADRQRLHLLKQRQDGGERLPHTDALELVVLEQGMVSSQVHLEALETAMNNAQDVVDVQAFQDDWAMLVAQKQAAYQTVADLVAQLWHAVDDLHALHLQQEALILDLPVKLQRDMMDIFWIDQYSMRQRMANNMFPSMGWSDVFLNALGRRLSSGAQLGQNDPGTVEIPPRLLEKFLEGKL